MSTDAKYPFSGTSGLEFETTAYINYFDLSIFFFHLYCVFAVIMTSSIYTFEAIYKTLGNCVCYSILAVATCNVETKYLVPQIEICDIIEVYRY